MEPIQEILKKRLRSNKLDRSATASEVCFYARRLLEKYFDATVAQGFSVRCLRGATLVIGVSHSGLAEELKRHQTPILTDLQRRFGAGVVTKIITQWVTRDNWH